MANLVRLLVAAASLLASQTAAGQPPCPAAPDVDRLHVIAPMAGEYPVWLVTDTRWPGPDAFAKSALVIARAALGPLNVRGRRLDTPGLLRFRDSGESPPTDAFRIDDPRRRSVTPGGAEPEVMAEYAFIMLGINYPVRGCWAVTVDLGARSTTIVREMR